MINKLNHGKVNGDSEELHALKEIKSQEKHSATPRNRNL